jgi:hypothetical protein
MELAFGAARSLSKYGPAVPSLFSISDSLVRGLLLPSLLAVDTALSYVSGLVTASLVKLEKRAFEGDLDAACEKISLTLLEYDGLGGVCWSLAARLPGARTRPTFGGVFGENRYDGRKSPLSCNTGEFGGAA